jgi:hypothetical protein
VDVETLEGFIVRNVPMTYLEFEVEAEAKKAGHATVYDPTDIYGYD